MGFITYDNLFWPGGASPTAFNFDGSGSVFDIYGLMFGIGGGRVVDLFSNGDITAVGNPPVTPGPNFYGVVVGYTDPIKGFAANYASANGLIFDTPEPSTWAMMVLGFVGLGFAGYRKGRKAAAIPA